MTPADLLNRELRRDGARPLITWYDATTGGRVELSVATTANWAAKTAGYLADELAIEAGEPVTIDPALHWLTAVVLLAAWVVGAEVEPGGTAVDVPLDPMGAGMSAIVAAYPDSFSPGVTSGADVVAAAPDVPVGARLLTVMPLDAEGVGWGLIAPLAASGSVVYAVPDGSLAARAGSERVTHTVGVDVPGLPRLA